MKAAYLQAQLAHPDIPEESVAAFPVPGGTCESLTRWGGGESPGGRHLWDRQD